MLFDLRSPGRRNLIRVVYALLAVLLGGGLVFFGIGGSGGGLFSDVGGGGGGDGGNPFEDDINAAEERLQTNPQDTAALAELIQLNYQAGSNQIEVNQETGAQSLTSEGEQQPPGERRRLGPLREADREERAAPGDRESPRSQSRPSRSSPTPPSRRRSAPPRALTPSTARTTRSPAGATRPGRSGSSPRPSPPDRHTPIWPSSSTAPATSRAATRRPPRPCRTRRRTRGPRSSSN